MSLNRNLQKCVVSGVISFTVKFTVKFVKVIRQKKEKQQYIAVGTIRMFIEPIAKH